MRYRFADCTLDTAAHRLVCGDAVRRVEPQVFDILRALAEADGDLVTYEALIDGVWRGRIVSDATLAARISAARAAVGDTGRAQAVIRTVPRRGVQLAVPVTREDASPAGAVRPAPPLAEARQVVRYTRSPDGTRIAYAVSGEGPPMMRGGHWLSHLDHDWSSPVWRPQIERFSARFRLIRYDPRGVGLSEPRLDDTAMDRFVDDMAAVADAAGLTRFPIFAASQSAPISLAYAARYPDRVSRIAILGGFAQGLKARGEDARNATMLDLIRSGWGKPGSAYLKAFATLYMPTATAEEIDSFVEMQAVSATPDLAVAQREAISALDAQAILADVRCPVLILHATGDALQPLAQGQTLAAGIPDAEFHSLDSANHVLVPSDPIWEEVMARVETFLAQD